MAQDQSLFRRLTRLFSNGPTIRRRVKDFKGESIASSAMDLFERSRNDVYSSVLSSYGSFDRMARYSDFAEMESTPEIASALDIYAEETVAQDEKGISLHVHSENRKIKELLETLFYDTLNTNFNLVMWVRNLCKYGDFFLFLDVSDEYGVINAYPIPISEIEREEGYDPENLSAARFRWMTKGNMQLENWQIGHFRMLGNDAFLPYGTSVLESARRIWRQLILMEDAMLVYRVIRSPERRVFYIDIGNIPPENVADYMNSAKDSLKRQAIIDKSNGKVDLRYNPYPVWEESVIPLLDGRNITIKELANEYSEGKENWVYSVQDKTHRIVPGKVTWCGKNYDASKLIRVWIDDGTWVMTAPEHPFMLRDGNSIRADELQPGHALMPFYRNENNRGYERCYNPETQTWETTHRLVATNVYNDNWQEKLINGKKPVVHHKNPQEGNRNKRNNSPENLEVMDFWEHRQWHIDQIQCTLLRPDVLSENRKRLIAWNSTDEHKKQVSETNRKYRKAQKMGIKYNNSLLHKEHNVIRSNTQFMSWNKDSLNRKIALQTVIPQEIWEFVTEKIKENSNISRDKLSAMIRCNESLHNLLVHANSNNKRDISKFHVNALIGVLKREGLCNGWSDFKQHILDSGYRNHKVDRIEEVFLDTGVYCMTVVGPNGEEDRHNFSMCSFSHNSNIENPIPEFNSGLFVMNSVDEDYFIPVRGGESGTKIDTLAGGTNTTAIEDVQYIQKKLFSALKIPKAYLGYDEDIGAKATLAQEDIRFSRTIQRIQQTVISELNKIAMIHLYSHGFDGESLIDFELKLSNPSSIAQQQKLELISTRFDIAGKAPEGVVDRHWVRKNVMNLTDFEIEKIEEGRINDKLEDLSIEKANIDDEDEGGDEGLGGGEFDDAGDFGDEEDIFAGDMPDTDLPLLTSAKRSIKKEMDNIDHDYLDTIYEDDDEDEDEDDEDKKLLVDLDKKPVKTDSQPKNIFGGNIKNSRKKTGGALKLSMPDMLSMTSTGRNTRSRDTLNNPYDKESSIKFNESQGPILTPYIADSINGLRTKAPKKISVLFESDDIDFTIED